MTPLAFDVVVIGAGPGGYVAAIRAAQLGLNCALIEREHVGGICLNWGCIPTKALLRSADVLRTARHAADYGLQVDAVRFDLAAMVKRSRGVAAQLQSGVRHLLKKHGVHLIEGNARLAGAGAIEVSSQDGALTRLTAPHTILASGARPRVVPGLEADGQRVWTYREAMTPAALPRSLLIVGSGAIGIEFASFYRALGVDVTVVEMLDRVLPLEDEEISRLAQRAFEKDGMTIHTGTSVKALERRAEGVTALLEGAAGSHRLEVDRVIVAIGTTANTERLGLEHTRVAIEHGRIRVNEWCETDEPGLFAIGDLTAGPWLAHKASHEGVLCAERIAGVADIQPLDRRRIPACTYGHPQVASIGFTEAQARAAGHEVRIGRFPFVGNGKALAMGETGGLVKTIFDATSGELLGAHLIGTEVTELIHGYAIGTTLEATEADYMHTVFPHPTLSEMLHESALQAYDHAIHI